MKTKEATREIENITIIDPPPFDGAWQKLLKTEYDPKHFWSEFRNNHVTGTVVNQLGTKPHQQAHFIHVGKTKNGYVYPSFSPKYTGYWLYKLNYNPISISDIQKLNANTVVHVKMELWELIPGQPDKYVGSAARVLLPGAQQGSIHFSRYVHSNKKYKLKFFTQVTIAYRQGGEGYGEAIVNFPSVSSRMLL